MLADESLKGAKGKTMGKEMQSYCARLVEEHEEEVRLASLSSCRGQL